MQCMSHTQSRQVTHMCVAVCVTECVAVCVAVYVAGYVAVCDAVYVTHTNTSGHTYECVMSHVWMSHMHIHTHKLQGMLQCVWQCVWQCAWQCVWQCVLQCVLQCVAVVHYTSLWSCYIQPISPWIGPNQEKSDIFKPSRFEPLYQPYVGFWLFAWSRCGRIVKRIGRKDSWYGVATISWIDKIIGLLCRISSVL